MIGICCVYLARNPMQFSILQTGIRQIRRTTRGPYRIYGAVPGANAQTIRVIEDLGVEVVHAPKERIEPSPREHSALLDHLIGHAISDGCSHIAAFDMDSWPILEGWDLAFGDFLGETAPLVSMVRTELGDNFPFLAFSYFQSSFWNPERSSVGLYGPASFSEEARECSVRPNETGSGLLAQLHDEKKGFWAVERTNSWSMHSVMGAVYGNAVFHLGAMSRNPRFITDRADYRLDGKPVKRRFAAAINAAAQAFAADEIAVDHDGFMKTLTGGADFVAPRRISPSEFKTLGGAGEEETPGAGAPASGLRRIWKRALAGGWHS